ncbi:(3R)-hydroxymyristoyl-[acyl carrier protein] dehydratase [gamma proteobacterium HdN1]|nr:(3R)-hydroxymyristoyl-[acyl carrier protein] dehydratase [gamma proteobacterium HdN1]
MIEHTEILPILPQRYPFLLVDRVLEVVPGEYCVAVKNITANEPQFTGHFPGNPIFPGMMLLEAMAQTAGVLAVKTRSEGLRERTAAVFVGVDNVRFRRPAIPGDQIIMRAELVTTKRNIWKFRCEAKIDGVLAAEAEILLTEKNL